MRADRTICRTSIKPGLGIRRCLFLDHYLAYIRGGNSPQVTFLPSCAVRRFQDTCPNRDARARIQSNVGSGPQTVQRDDKQSQRKRP